MTKYQMEFSGPDENRFVVIDDGRFSANPYISTIGTVLTDSLVEDIASSIASNTGRTLYGVWKLNTVTEL